MGFHETDAYVRCEIFRDRHGGAGKWYATIALDMSGEYDAPLLDQAITRSLLRQLDVMPGGGRRRFGGMWAVVLDPHNVHAHPMIIQIPN